MVRQIVSVAIDKSVAHTEYMSEIEKILENSTPGDPAVAEQLLPLVYEELRKLAAAKLAREPAGHSLQATSLVHEAYMRLVKNQKDAQWDGRGHFFSAAAEAMRRILVDRARRKKAIKHGGDRKRKHFAEDLIVAPETNIDLIELDSALTSLAEQSPRKVELVKLRYFIGLTLKEAADVLGIGISTADRDWAYARAWLYRHISTSDQ